MHRKIVSQLQIAYLETYQRFIWQLHKAQFFGYCGTIIYIRRITQLFTYCKLNNYFTTGNRLNIWLLCINKLYDNLKSHIWKHFEDLYSFCAKPNFYATAHLSFCYCESPKFYVLQIDKLFHASKSSTYLFTVHTKIVRQLQIPYLETYQRLISLLCKTTILGYCASII